MPGVLVFAALIMLAEPGQGSAPVLIVPRTAWDPAPLHAGTRYPAGVGTRFESIVVHHSDFVDSPGPLVIKDYHLEVSGFGDIGYHFVVGVEGTVYAGRDLDRVGAHAGATAEAARGKGRHLDPDWGSIGVVLDGYYVDARPPPAQLDGLKRLIAGLRQRYPSIKRVIGHREVRSVLVEERGLTPLGPPTVCPGDALFAWLEEERAAGEATKPTVAAAPTPPPTVSSTQ